MVYVRDYGNCVGSEYGVSNCGMRGIEEQLCRRVGQVVNVYCEGVPGGFTGVLLGIEENEVKLLTKVPGTYNDLNRSVYDLDYYADGDCRKCSRGGLSAKYRRNGCRSGYDGYVRYRDDEIGAVTYVPMWKVSGYTLPQI